MASAKIWVTGIVLVIAWAAIGGPTLAGASNTPMSTATETQSPCVGTDATSTADGVNALSPERTTSTGPDRSHASSRPTVNVSYTYDRLPERRTVVEVTMRLDPPEDVDSLTIEFRNESTVLEATGLVRNGTSYELTGNSTAKVVYREPINSTYLGDVGDNWTLFGHVHPAVDVGNGTRVVETFAVDGEGYVGRSGVGYTAVVLGDHDVYRRTLDGETIEIAVPAGVSPLYEPRLILDALANASRSLDIGGKDGVVSAIVPREIDTGVDKPGFTAIQPGESLIIVEKEGTLDAWIHEYVHTRQAYKPSRETRAAEGMRWLSEASARYYESLLLVEHGYSDWWALETVFRQAVRENGVLAEPDTWSGRTDYAKGALVLATIDREIRSATDGNRTLQDVLRRVNTPNSNLTVDRFVRTVRDVGGDAAANTAEKYITTRAIPDRFDAFASVYGYEDAEIQRTVTELTADGPGWNRSLDGAGFVRIGVNETLRIDARVSNEGEAPGLALLAPLVSSGSGSFERVDRRWVGRLAPGKNVTRTAGHRFDGPGRYELRFVALSQNNKESGRTLAVKVVPERNTASVAALEATSNGSTDGRVDVTVRLRNDGPRATFVELPVTVDGERVSALALVLDGGETRTATVTVDAPAGTDSPRVVVDDAETTVGSTPWTATPDPGTESTPSSTTGNTGTATTPTSTTGPGFGVATVLAAVMLLAALVRGNGSRGRR